RALAPARADHRGGDGRMVGMLSASFGVGAAIGMGLLAFLGSKLASQWVSSVGLSGMAAGCVVLTFGVVPAVALAGFALAGLGFGAAMTGLATVVQERA